MRTDRSKTELHPRNRHRQRYDFKKLVRACPELSKHVAVNIFGDESIDFADPAAVKALNRAILKQEYGITDWEIPQGYLCPPIPGRADYLHHVADLLAGSGEGPIPKGPTIRILDIGCGANCVYPLIGHSEYGWSFVGSDTDPVALKSAQKVLHANGKLADAIELRCQKNPERIFEGIIEPEERFDLTICNPPFHASLNEAQAGTRRKWRNLDRSPTRKGAAVLNFGGMGSEIWCKGGERAFILRMVQESTRYQRQCRWFSTLVSKESNLLAIGNALEQAKCTQRKLIEMAQGQKKSRIVAWTFARPTSSSALRTQGNSERY
jgi:23S rRNA (adenine1618-N6)-methyltransferase